MAKDSQNCGEYLSWSHPKAFEFCIPIVGTKVPSGPEWLPEIKYDGYRLRVEHDGAGVFADYLLILFVPAHRRKGGRHMLRSVLLAATAAVIMSATPAMADNKSDCQKGVAMIKAELKKEHPEPVLATLRGAPAMGARGRGRGAELDRVHEPRQGCERLARK